MTTGLVSFFIRRDGVYVFIFCIPPPEVVSGQGFAGQSYADCPIFFSKRRKEVMSREILHLDQSQSEFQASVRPQGIGDVELCPAVDAEFDMDEDQRGQRRKTEDERREEQETQT